MANLPELRSKSQIIGDLIDGFLARVPYLDDLNRGSIISQFFQAIGQSQFKAAADVISMIDALSVDRASGEALQRLARDKNVTISPGTFASGRVDITDTSIQKISSLVFTGQPAPVAGSLVIYVSDASDFTINGGEIYIGRGTPNVEGPLSYDSVQQEGGGTYWSITLNSASPTTKFHNVGEEVVLAQGGRRTIPSGTVVKTASGSGVNSVSFKTNAQADIPDGEVKVTDVSVTCEQLGIIGNVPRGAIRQADGTPFAASVFNANAFTNGTPPDDEEAIRDKIKRAEQAKSKGTEEAIRSAAIGVTSPDDLKTVQSADILRFADSSAALIFDDGSGYEPIFDGVGIEQVLDYALGGEKELQLRKYPVASARVETLNLTPFSLSGGEALEVTVANETTTHFFDAGDFKVPSKATAFEVAASINGNSNLNFTANTAGGGQSVVIFPKDRDKNDIQVKERSSSDANAYLNFPTQLQRTLLLYKNDQLLFQDGKQAFINTRDSSTWSTSITAGDTLIYSVDGTPPITVTFSLAAFRAVDIGATVSAFTSLDIWAAVMNDLMTGVVVTVDGQALRLASARGESSQAVLEILGGTIQDKMFTVGADLSSTGIESQFTLNKETGQIELAEALVPGDQITAGSSFTRANITTTDIADGPSGEGNVWLVVDGDVTVLENGLAGDSVTTFARDGVTEKVTISATTPSLDPIGFDLVQPNDWVIVWAEQDDLADYPALYNFQGFWRVEEVKRGEIVVDDQGGVSPNGAIVPSPRGPNGTLVIPTDRILIVRTDAVVQQLSFTASTLTAFAQSIENQIAGVETTIIGSQVRISTKTAGSNGELAILAADSGGKSLGINPVVVTDNIPSQQGFVETLSNTLRIPSFTWGTVTDRIDSSTIELPEYLEIGGSYDNYIVILNSYDISNEIQKDIPDTIAGKPLFTKSFNQVNDQLSLETPLYVQKQVSVQTADRYYMLEGLRFDSTDVLTAIIDDDLNTKVFGLPVARKMTVDDNSNPTLLDISIADAESSLELNDAASFAGFSFDDWKIWRQSNATLTDGTYDIRVKYADLGPNGDTVRVGFVYPKTAATTQLEVNYLNEEMAGIGITLPVQEARTATWDGSSAFTVDVTNISPAKDEVTFTWRVGTEPQFQTGPVNTQVSIGDIVLIASNSDFLTQNRGIQAKITGVTDKSFTAELLAGITTSDNIEIDSIQTVNGVMTVTTSTPHLMETGDRVGLWDTAPISGSTKPYDFVFRPDITGASSFEIDVTGQIPGGTIVQATHSDNLVTAITQSAHGLQAGNMVIISGFAISNYNGLAVVNSVGSSTQFTYIRAGSSATVINGRFDYQTYGLTGVSSISSISKAGGVVTVNTTLAHGLSNGQLVSVSGSDIDDWNIATSYDAGDVIEYASVLYKSLVNGNIGNQPDISPASWEVTTEDLNIAYVINNVTGANSFEATYLNSTGDTNATGGSLSVYSAQAKLARALGNSAANLAFVNVETTAQEVIDFVTESFSDVLEMSLGAGKDGTEVISSSTADNDLATGYLSCGASNVRTLAGSRLLEITVDANLPAGSSVSLSGTAYDDSYIVLSTEETVPSTEWVITVLSDTTASATADNAVVGTIVGQTQYVALVDGERSVASTDLAALPSDPMITIKDAWITVPQIGDDIALVAVRRQHLVDFWNRLVVTGLANVSEIQRSQVDSQIQITTNTFGRSGSVEIAGGSANEKTVAFVGSGSEIDGKYGVFRIPYELRGGLTVGSWANLSQTVTQNKALGLTANTIMETQANGLEITSGPGSFQTQRAISSDETSIFKVELHGDFVAVINIGGTAVDLESAGVKEGDWVRLRNNLATAWSNASSYVAGDRVSFNGLSFTAINASTNAVPVKPVPDQDWDIDETYNTNDVVRYKNAAWRYDGLASITGDLPDESVDWVLVWEVQEWAGGNTGIFRVVRVFGDDTFYIQNENAVEEIIDLGDAANLAFYSYDSVMPGDVLTITGSVFGATNSGRYVVQDDDGTNSFPTASRIWTEQIPVSGVSTALGERVNQVNVEEADPVSLWKRIIAVSPASSTLAAVIVDTPNLMNRLSSSNAAFATVQGKLGYTTLPQFGIDAYLHFNGLIKELNRILYGDPTSPDEFPGVVAAGTDVAIQAAIIKRITIDMSVRVKTGIPFSEVREAAKAAAAGYINTLGVGESIAMSKVVEAVSKVGGITSVVITFPSYTIASDRIPVGSQEKALVGDPTNDITVSVLGT